MNHSRSAEGDANAGVLVGPSFPAVMRGGEVELELLKMGAFVAAEMTPRLFASGVKMPVLMVQVLEDEWTRNPEDTQKTFDLLGSTDKELLRFENTKRRFRDGYNYFGRHPEKIIAFFDKHMK